MISSSLLLLNIETIFFIWYATTRNYSINGLDVALVVSIEQSTLIGIIFSDVERLANNVPSDSIATFCEYVSLPRKVQTC